MSDSSIPVSRSLAAVLALAFLFLLWLDVHATRVMDEQRETMQWMARSSVVCTESR